MNGLGSGSALTFVVVVAAVGGLILGGAALSSSLSGKKAVSDLSARIDSELTGVSEVRNELSSVAGRTQGSLDEMRQDIWVLREQLSNSLVRASGTTKSQAGTSKTDAKVDTTPTVPGAQYHTIQAGDIVGRVAKKYGTTAEAIKKLNPGLDDAHLKIGQKLRVK